MGKSGLQSESRLVLWLWGGVIGATAGAACSMTTQIMAGGEVNWTSVKVAGISGLVSGAIAASPLGLPGQVIAGGLIGGASYAADCYFNDNPIRIDEMIVATFGGVVAGWLGGPGANEHLVLTNTIKTAMETIHRMASRNCIKYAEKMIASTKSWRNNILSFAALKGSVIFGVGCGISNGLLAAYQKGTRRKSPRCRRV